MKSISKPPVRDADAYESDTETLRSNSTSKLYPMKSVKKLASSLTKNDQIDEFLRIERKKLQNIEGHKRVLYLNTVVLKEVMQHAEFHFVYGDENQRQLLKDEAVLLLMVEYYEDNTDVLKRFQELVVKKVSKYGFFRRLCVRMYNRLLKKRAM